MIDALSMSAALAALARAGRGAMIADYCVAADSAQRAGAMLSALLPDVRAHVLALTLPRLMRLAHG